MSHLTSEMLSLLLSNCVKQFGRQNVLRLEDQEVLNPSVLSLHPDEECAILMLLEGQEQIDAWDEGMKKLEETVENRHEDPADEPMRQMIKEEQNEGGDNVQPEIQIPDTDSV